MFLITLHPLGSLKAESWKSSERRWTYYELILKETTVVQEATHEKPPLPNKCTKFIWSWQGKKSDLFFCITSFFFFKPWNDVHRNACCPHSLCRILPFPKYERAPSELMQPLSIWRQPKARPPSLYCCRSQSVSALKGFDSPAWTLRDIPVSSRVVMNRSHGRPSSSRMKIWNTHKGS